MDMHQVRNGPRLLTFEGHLLGHVSSKRPGVYRWTDLTLYLTEGGSYVLERVGRSVVTHMPDCGEIRGKLPRFQDAHPGDDPDYGYHYHACVPETYDFTQLLVEEDWYSAITSEEPEKIVDVLEYKKNGTRSLPRLSTSLLEMCCERYPTFGDFWRVDTIA